MGLVRAGCVATAMLLSVVLAGCAGSTSGDRTSSSAVLSSPAGGSQAGSTSRSPSPKPPSPVRDVPYLADVNGRRVFGFVGPPGGVRGKVRLRVSTFGDSRFVTIGPDLPPSTSCPPFAPISHPRFRPPTADRHFCRPAVPMSRCSSTPCRRADGRSFHLFERVMLSDVIGLPGEPPHSRTRPAEA